MGCKSCGEKPKCAAKGFPSAVIEINNPEKLTLLRKVVIPLSMGTEEAVPPAVGKYRNVILKYESNGHIYIYSSDGIPTFLEVEIPEEIWNRIKDLEDGLAELEQEFEDFKNSPDVVDIVADYAELQAYDTSTLGDKDIIRVLRDETHDGESAYYRWDKPNSQWIFIGTVGDYYTKAQTDILLNEKQDELTAGDNIAIEDESGALVISATDTTYSDFVGTDGQTGGTAGLVPAPATTDAGKVLGANGTWVQGGPTVVQTTGISTTDVMSQDAVTSMVFSDPSTAHDVRIGSNRISLTTGYNVAIGANSVASTKGVAIGGDSSSSNGTRAGDAAVAIGNKATAGQTDTIAIGSGATANTNSKAIAIGLSSTAVGENAVAIGGSSRAGTGAGVAVGRAAKANGARATALGQTAEATADDALAVGDGAEASAAGSVAIGSASAASTQGEMNIGLPGSSALVQSTYGYNGSEYRLLTGLYNPQSAHDAATKGYVDGIASYSTSEVNTGATWIDGSAIYKKTIDTGTLPNNSTTGVSHGILNMDRVIKAEGWARTTSGLQYFLSTSNHQAGGDPAVLVSAVSVGWGTTKDLTDYDDSYVTIYYTKSS